jgi:hypothetical protein
MAKWIRRLLAAHFFGSYLAWLALLVVVLLHSPHDKDLIAGFIWWVVAPIVVPIVLISPGHGRFHPWWTGVIFWWVYGAVFGLIIIGWLRIEKRRDLLRKRARQGLCPRCGYDLRGSPERCPECGRERVQSEIQRL